MHIRPRKYLFQQGWARVFISRRWGISLFQTSLAAAYLQQFSCPPAADVLAQLCGPRYLKQPTRLYQWHKVSAYLLKRARANDGGYRGVSTLLKGDLQTYNPQDGPSVLDRWGSYFWHHINRLKGWQHQCVRCSLFHDVLIVITVHLVARIQVKQLHERLQQSDPQQSNIDGPCWG